MPNTQVKTTNPENVKYLAFEGGGGKGVAYLGAIKGLEEVGILPLKKVLNSDKTVTAAGNEFLGISGASAGAITAFLLAMGATSEDIENELNRTQEYEHYTSREKYMSSVFDSFFDFGHENCFPEYSVESFSNGNIPEASYIRVIDIIGGTAKTGLINKPHDESFGWDTLGKIAYSRINEFSALIDTIQESVPLQIIMNYYNRQPTALDSLESSFWESIITTINPFHIDGNAKMTTHFLKNLLYHKGVFSGIGVRKYFIDLLSKYLTKNFINVVDYIVNPRYIDHKIKDGSLSFKEFQEITGVDLRITGTNITKGKTFIFSTASTPNFPIVEAVCISMNLPGAFKPIVIKDLNKELDGEWVDGGLMNNYPIHAFDSTEGVTNDYILGFRLQHDKLNEEEEKEQEEALPLGKLLGSIFDIFFAPSEDGQIRSPQDKAQTIKIETYQLDVMDFSPPEELREEPIKNAYKQVMNYFKK